MLKFEIPPTPNNTSLTPAFDRFIYDSGLDKYQAFGLAGEIITAILVDNGVQGPEDVDSIIDSLCFSHKDLNRDDYFSEVFQDGVERTLQYVINDSEVKV